jgi:DNA-binding FadR family transcriptional regulator
MSLGDLTAVDARRLSDRVAAAIEDRIFSGEWEPGRRLPPEPELGRQLKVSRAVIRDAVQALAARGLVEVRHGVGTSVAEPTDRVYADSALSFLLRTDATVLDALRARCELEVAVVALAAAARDDHDLWRLDGLFAEITAAAAVPDVTRARAVDLRFHSAILEATHMPVLVALLNPLRWIIQRTSDAPRDDAAFLDLAAHGELLEALRAGDAARSCKAMREHFAFIDDPRYAALHRGLLRDAPLTGDARAELRGAG